MSKLSERQRLAITIGLSVLMAGGIVALILMDREKIDEIEAEIAIFEQRIAAANIEIAKIPPREDKVIVFRAVERRELEILPTEQKIADFHGGIATFLASAGIRFDELPESKPEDSELAKGIRVTRNQIRGRGNSSSILKFLNMIESDPRLVAVKGIKVQAGDRTEDKQTGEVLPAEHEFRVELETYFYRPAGNEEMVRIPGAERRLQDPKIQEAIAAFEPERPDVYVLRPAASRRDPLVDPRKRRVVEDPAIAEEERRRQEDEVLKLEGSWNEIAELMEQERALLAAGDLFRADRVGNRIDERVEELQAQLDAVTHMKTVTLSEMVERLDVIKDSLERRRGARPAREKVVTRGVAAKVLADATQLFEQAAYADLSKVGSEWVDYLRGKNVKPDAQQLLNEMNTLLERGRDLQDWTGFSFRVTGTIIDRTDPRRSVAIINKRYHKVGDVMDESEEVVVDAISGSSVRFRFRGERPSVPVRSSSASVPVRGVSRPGKSTRGN